MPPWTYTTGGIGTVCGLLRVAVLRQAERLTVALLGLCTVIEVSLKVILVAPV